MNILLLVKKLRFFVCIGGGQSHDLVYFWMSSTGLFWNTLIFGAVWNKQAWIQVQAICLRCHLFFDHHKLVGIYSQHNNYFTWTMVLYAASLVAQMVKNMLSVQEIWVQFLGREDLLGKEMITHSGILAWRILWTEESGRLQSLGLQSRTQLSDWQQWYIEVKPNLHCFCLRNILQTHHYYLNSSTFFYPLLFQETNICFHMISRIFPSKRVKTFVSEISVPVLMETCNSNWIENQSSSISLMWGYYSTSCHCRKVMRLKSL